ncbi:Glycoside hydrolase [Trema orientale]|uniref:Glycoside hydrolase n=1 Tax=Trema orientale TaxID=63057 RepID=A0A2P5FH48_TREOI|nr:Glycoside hydrolase [Trema orientale]
MSLIGMHFNVMKDRYITSDCDAVATVFGSHHYAKNPEDAVADILKAGTDIGCGAFLYRHTLSAIEQGKVQEEDVDRALLNLFSVQLRLGLFNGDPLKGRYGGLGPQDVCNSEHKELALEAARQGIVLLKNDHNFLPLKKGVDLSLALIGPLSNNSVKLRGGYAGNWFNDLFLLCMWLLIMQVVLNQLGFGLKHVKLLCSLFSFVSALKSKFTLESISKLYLAM